MDGIEYILLCQLFAHLNQCSDIFQIKGPLGARRKHKSIDAGRETETFLSKAGFSSSELLFSSQFCLANRISLSFLMFDRHYFHHKLYFERII